MEELLKCIEEVLDINKGRLKPDDRIAEVEEWDSIAYLQIISELEERFDIRIPIEEINQIKTVKDIYNYAKYKEK